MPARLLRISGSVQGVFFRANAKELADKLGITGWARNDDDGCVTIHMEGPHEAMTEFEEWCHRGPPAANVTSVEAADAVEQKSSEFRIIL
jgi:acylphosphatase